MKIDEISRHAAAIRSAVEHVIMGKSPEINLIIAALFADGHVLLEDVPGTGKTVLAKALAKCVSCEFGRIQFTPDLLPSDLTGINVYSPKSGEFMFKKGALFTNILLADEINRATPRTQSGLLESMEERQITVDGVSYPLTPPYFVIATQNPIETQGTFPLPEAQLDRFLIRLSLGYPTHDESVGILKRFEKNSPFDDIVPVCNANTIVEIRHSVKDVHIHDDILSYIIDLAEKTRSHENVSLGVSTRGGISLMNLSRAYAALNGRGYVTPDDIQMLAPYVFTHRIKLRGGLGGRALNIKAVIDDIISATPVPTENWK